MAGMGASVIFDFSGDTRAVELRLLSGRGHYETVVRAVMQASRSVWISTANLKELMVEDGRAVPGRARTASRQSYRSVIGVFAELVARGVELRILHGGPPSRRFRAELANHPGLMARAGAAVPATARSGGLEMRLCPRVHFKAVIVDGAMLYLGSANWTGAGLGAKGTGRRNFELGVVTGDDVLLDEVQALFDGVWRGAGCRGCRLRAICPSPLDGKAGGHDARP
jgi:phosphatidylserine/phosphatidylglycerophosphate/cardiolipin synthase-like enzyme